MPAAPGVCGACWIPSICSPHCGICAVQAELRPQVLDEVRREVDPQLRQVLAKLQV